MSNQEQVGAKSRVNDPTTFLSYSILQTPDTAPMQSYSMEPISELSTTTMWRATTATGETQFFHLKLIALDWAGPKGSVEKVKDIRTGQSTKSVGNSLNNAPQPAS
ncbi:MAG: hypothetical protein LCH90_01270 [Proteobacteria bacterium]|nr:hypothetical protein [Pseudomonadota bacterium]